MRKGNGHDGMSLRSGFTTKSQRVTHFSDIGTPLSVSKSGTITKTPSGADQQQSPLSQYLFDDAFQVLSGSNSSSGSTSSSCSTSSSGALPIEQVGHPPPRQHVELTGRGIKVKLLHITSY